MVSKRWKATGAAIATAIVVCLAMPAPFASADSVEDTRVAKIKSAYLLNFLRFTEWPRNSFADTTSPVQICLLGQDTLGAVLDGTVEGQAVGGRPIEIIRLETDRFALEHNADTSQRLRRCHMVFISDSEEPRLSSILRNLSGADTLTVGETGSFARLGTMLALNLERDRIIFYANPDAIRAANVNLSSKILQLARIVPENDRRAEE